jgi:hypothetical protein
MKKEMFNFLSDLADVLEKHNGGLTYTSNDDGIYAMMGEFTPESWKNKINIGYPSDGSSEIRGILNWAKDNLEE